MPRRTRTSRAVTLAASLVTLTAAGAVLGAATAGVGLDTRGTAHVVAPAPTGTTVPAVHPSPPPWSAPGAGDTTRAAPVSATALHPFGDCERLRRWYVHRALPLVGPWGLGRPYPMPYGSPTRPQPDGAMRTATSHAATAGAPTAVGNSPTGSNIEEAGVDEPDLAKTDGRVVVSTRHNHLVVTDVTGARPHRVARLRLPRNTVAPELMLAGERVVVLSGRQPAPGPVGPDLPVPDAPLGAGIAHGGPAYGRPVRVTRILTVDLTDPSRPKVVRRDRITGGLVSARRYGGTVRVVVSDDTPDLDLVHPKAGRGRAEATRQNQRLVRQAPLDAWLPRVRTTRDGNTTTHPLLTCQDVRRPGLPGGLGTIAVLTFDAAHPAERSSTGVAAAGGLVYSSSDRLYVATRGSESPVPATPVEPPHPVTRRHLPRMTTQIHAFALGDGTTTYLASGTVPGRVADRWSFDEHGGHLRVATALGRRPWDPRENAVVVLAERNHRLVQQGRVTGLGVGESIQSVRWLGDLAVVTTFKQTDPLYTVDLSDPTHPRLTGTLHIRGFSSYLHPVGAGHLLGLGQDATGAGRLRGAQAAVFDMDRPNRRARRLGSVRYGPHTSLGAAMDPRAFTYLPARHLALTALQSDRHGAVRVAMLHVGEDGGLTSRTTARVSRWDGPSVRVLPVAHRRLALVVRGTVSLLGPGAAD